MSRNWIGFGCPNNSTVPYEYPFFKLLILGRLEPPHVVLVKIINVLETILKHFKKKVIKKFEIVAAKKYFELSKSRCFGKLMQNQ